MQKYRIALHTFVAIVMGLSGSLAIAEEWVNPDTQTYYYVSPKFDNWSKAVEFCHSKGLALFDPRYAPQGEEDILVDPRLNELFEWTDAVSVNKNLDRSKVAIWLGAGLNEYGSRLLRGSSSQVLLRDNKTGKIFSTQEWAASYYNSNQAVCFQPSDFWYSCSGQIYCEEKNAVVGSFGKWHLFDFGPSASEAINRIVDRSAAPVFSGSNGNDCYLDKNISCERVLP